MQTVASVNERKALALNISKHIAVVHGCKEPNRSTVYIWCLIIELNQQLFTRWWRREIKVSRRVYIPLASTLYYYTMLLCVQLLRVTRLNNSFLHKRFCLRRSLYLDNSSPKPNSWILIRHDTIEITLYDAGSKFGLSTDFLLRPPARNHGILNIGYV